MTGKSAEAAPGKTLFQRNNLAGSLQILKQITNRAMGCGL